MELSGKTVLLRPRVFLCILLSAAVLQGSGHLYLSHVSGFLAAENFDRRGH